MPKQPVNSVVTYFASDYSRTLFPMKSTQLLVSSFGDKLKEHVYKVALVSGFLPQQRCYAAKRGHNLRRTVKLDPVAEYFAYDLVFRNRARFRPDHRPSRRSYGYRFKGGAALSVTDEHTAFRAAIAAARSRYDSTLKVDVAACFNSIYHHDLVNSFREGGWAEADVSALDRFLKDCNSGRSVDCLPQGIHPCKALGSEYLRFLDNSVRLRSELGLRFLDDIHLFDDDEGVLTHDLGRLQEILGEKGLSLNDQKTRLGDVDIVDVPQEVDDMKLSLLTVRREAFDSGGDDVEIEEGLLDEEQVAYLLDLLESPDLDEADAELVLVLLSERSEEVLERMGELLRKYPGLAKAVYQFARIHSEPPGLDKVVLDFLRDAENATEYQLFWLGRIAEDHLAASSRFGDIAAALLGHPRSTILSRAKVLEIPTNRFGLPELRDEVLRSGRSDWEAWGAICGTRGMKRASRNHQLSYAAKSSPLNGLISECVQAMPD